MYSTISFESGNGKQVSAEVRICTRSLYMEIESITINGVYNSCFGMRWERIHKLIDIIQQYVDISEHVADVLQERRESYELSFID